ncbi:MAG: Uncharacterised protein [Synechococcus sp. CC9902]|nr:MAG: Uncharacterised protein [Synechococcus sp. CC9902]
MQQGAAVGGHHKAAAVEHQLVVAAHLVQINHRASQASGRFPGKASPQLRFARVEGRCGQIDHQVGLLLRQSGDRVRSRQPFTLQIVLHPEVFADGQPQFFATLQGQQTGAIAGAEVTALIKNVVARQQLLAGHGSPSLMVHQGDAVEQVWRPGVAGRQSHTDQQGTGTVQLLNEPVENCRLFSQL